MIINEGEKKMLKRLLFDNIYENYINYYTVANTQGRLGIHIIF